MTSITVVVIIVAMFIAFRGLYAIAASSRARERGAKVSFPANKALVGAVVACGSIFVLLAVWTASAKVENAPVWVTGMFLLLALLCLPGIPPTLTIDQDGVRGRTLSVFRSVRLPWREIRKIELNRQNSLTTVTGSDGAKVYHTGFHVDPQRFRDEVQKATKLPLTVITPGFVDDEITEIPYTGE